MDKLDTRLPVEIRQQLSHMTEHLVEEFQDQFPPDTVAARVGAHLAEFQDARVLTFVPTLVYRYSREDLKAQAA